MGSIDLVGLGAVLVGLAAIITAFRTGRKVETVRDAVKKVAEKVDGVDLKVDTLNETTLGELGAEGETRRVRKMLEHGDAVSAKEQRHVDAAQEDSNA